MNTHKDINITHTPILINVIICLQNPANASVNPVLNLHVTVADSEHHICKQICKQNNTALFNVSTEKLICTRGPFLLPLSSPDDPAVSQRHGGGGPRAGCAPNLWGDVRFPPADGDVVTVSRPPSPQRPSSRADADPAGRHPGRRGLLQLLGCQQRGQPRSQERQSGCQE